MATNPFTAKIAKKKGTNPFTAKVKAKKAATPVNNGSSPAKPKFSLKFDRNASEIKKFQEIVDAAVIAYEASSVTESKIFARLDKAKPGSDRWLALHEEWVNAANICDRRMNTVMSATTALRRAQNGEKGEVKKEWKPKPRRPIRASANSEPQSVVTESPAKSGSSAKKSSTKFKLPAAAGKGTGKKELSPPAGGRRRRRR